MPWKSIFVSRSWRRRAERTELYCQSGWNGYGFSRMQGHIAHVPRLWAETGQIRHWQGEAVATSQRSGYCYPGGYWSHWVSPIESHLLGQCSGEGAANQTRLHSVISGVPGLCLPAPREVEWTTGQHPSCGPHYLRPHANHGSFQAGLFKLEFVIHRSSCTIYFPFVSFYFIFFGDFLMTSCCVSIGMTHYIFPRRHCAYPDLFSVAFLIHISFFLAFSVLCVLLWDLLWSQQVGLLHTVLPISYRKPL